MTDEIKDFSRPRGEEDEPLKFKIDDDVFECTHELTAGAQFILAEMATDDPMKQMRLLGELLDAILLPSSAPRFLERMKDPANPITTQQFADIFTWLMEVYTARPLLLYSGSADGLATTGQSSTGGASV